MKLKSIWLAVVVALGFAPCVSLAFSWSTCHTVTAVTNYIAYSNTVTVVLYPGVPACNNDAPGAVTFRVGQMNVTADSLKSLLASATAAHLSGKGVMIFFDESNQMCFASAISVGGYAGQCP